MPKLTVQKKVLIIWGLILQEHGGFIVPSKLSQNLSSRKWLKPSCNLVNSLIPTWSWILKILFSVDLIKFIRAFIRRWNCKFFGRLYSTDLWHTEGNNFTPARKISEWIRVSRWVYYRGSKIIGIFWDFIWEKFVKQT